MKSILLLLLAGATGLAATETPAVWSFDQKTDRGYASGEQLFTPLRQATPVAGVEGMAVRLSRLDALRLEQVRDVVADGVFSIQFWVKVEWASRRYDHGDILNFITPDENRPWTWRIGFAEVMERQLPRGEMPLVLRIGADFDTDSQPIEIAPWRWTHVAYVGDGKKVAVYRNGGLLGSVWWDEGELGDTTAVTGVVQINGSPDYDVITEDTGADLEAKRTAVWECDLRFDELVIADHPLAPEIAYPAALGQAPATAARRHRLSQATVDAKDRFAVASLIRRAEAIDNGPDTREMRDDLLAQVDQALAAIASGTPALRSQRGHLKLSYWSAVDQSEQFYEVYVPHSWDGAEPAPLVVAFHGGGEDESVLFERYTIEERAEEKGWIVVCPYGRGQVGYRDAGERDVLDVVAEVKYQWPVDETRIYAFGHSMGAYGSWRLAVAHPELFAAIAPIAGRTDRDHIEKLRHLPVFWVVGDADSYFTKEQIDEMVAHAKELDAPHSAWILEGYDHGGFLGFQWPTVVEVALPRIFDFFAEHHR